MSRNDAGAELAQKKNELLGPIFQFVGVVDILLGFFIALGVPHLIGEDPALQPALNIVAAFLALTGIGFFVWGRFFIDKRSDDDRSPTVMR